MKLQNNKNNESYEIKMIISNRTIISIIGLLITIVGLAWAGGKLNNKIDNNAETIIVMQMQHKDDIKFIQDATNVELNDKVNYEVFRISTQNLKERIDNFITQNKEEHERIMNRMDSIDVSLKTLNQYLMEKKEI